MNPSAPTAQDREWFYILRGEIQGPLSSDDFRHLFASRALPLDTRVWTDGVASWVPAGDVAWLREHLPHRESSKEGPADSSHGPTSDSCHFQRAMPAGKLGAPTSGVGYTARWLGAVRRWRWTIVAVASPVVLLLGLLAHFGSWRGANEPTIPLHSFGADSSSRPAGRGSTVAGRSVYVAPPPSKESTAAPATGSPDLSETAHGYGTDNQLRSPVVWKTWASRDDLDRIMVALGFVRNGPPAEFAHMHRHYLSSSPPAWVTVRFDDTGRTATELTVGAARSVEVFRSTLQTLQRDVFDAGTNLELLVTLGKQHYELASKGQGRGKMLETARTLQERTAARYTSDVSFTTPHGNLRVYASRFDLLNAGVLNPISEADGGDIALQVSR